MTSTVSVQDPLAAMDPPVNVVDPLPATAVTVPPQVSLALPDTTTPVGNESVRGPVSVAAELFGLLRVMVRVDTPPAAIVAGLNDFTTVGGIVGTAHADMETVLESIVTAPLRARALPDIVALVSREMLVKARIFPMKAVPVPSVAELPTCQ